MGPLDLAIAILVAFLGAAVLFILCYILFSPFKSIFAAQRGQSTLRRAAKLLDLADTLIEDKRSIPAISVLKRAVIFEQLNTVPLIYALRDHHQAVLSRCVLVADDLNSRADNLPQVEKLMGERVELLHLLVKANISYTAIKERRTTQGKELPEWGRTDFEQRIKQIKTELKGNSEKLSAALDELFNSLGKAGKAGDVVYH